MSKLIRVMSKNGRERPSVLLKSGLKELNLWKYGFQNYRSRRQQIKTTDNLRETTRTSCICHTMWKTCPSTEKMPDPEWRQSRCSIASLGFQEFSSSTTVEIDEIQLRMTSFPLVIRKNTNPIIWIRFPWKIDHNCLLSESHGACSRPIPDMTRLSFELIFHLDLGRSSRAIIWW